MTNNGGSGAGNGNGDGGQGSGGLVIPKTFEELEKVMADDKLTGDEKSNIIAEYEKAQKV